VRLKLSYLLTFIALSASSQSLTEIRKEFHKAVIEPEERVKAFHAYLEDIDNPDATIQAYQAVSEALLAQVVWNPFSKLSQVRKYDKLMEEAVISDEMNIEIRFLRLAIEYNLPSFLGMSTHIEEDLNVIVKNLESISSMNVDPSYGRYILYFLENTNLCSNDELIAMRDTLGQNIPY